MENIPCLCSSLRDAARITTERFNEQLKPSGLKVTMFRLLRRLSRADQPTISELARIVDLDRSTLGRNLKVLERDGLICLESGGDERVKIVVLTHEGHSALKLAEPLWQKAQQETLQLLRSDSSSLLNALALISALPDDRVSKQQDGNHV